MQHTGERVRQTGSSQNSSGGGWPPGLLRDVFHIIHHFHQSHLGEIQDWHELNRRHFKIIISINLGSKQCWNCGIKVFSHCKSLSSISFELNSKLRWIESSAFYESSLQPS
jgi:hypothetical protein